jgi:hypothetical protein
MNDGAASTSILKIVEQESHPGSTHLVLGHLVIEDGFVEFLALSRYLPVIQTS